MVPNHGLARSVDSRRPAAPASLELAATLVDHTRRRHYRQASRLGRSAIGRLVTFAAAAAAVASSRCHHPLPLMLSAALEWRPDGKQLAVGLEDGTLLLLNTEDGEVQHKAQLLPDSALVVINWTEAALASQDSANPAQQPQAMASSQLQGDRARRMFAPPPPPVPPATAGLSVGYSTCGRSGSSTQAWAPQAQQLAVLACASAAGDVVLCTSRLFPLAQLELPSLLGCPRLELLRLATEPSLQQLTVCWRDTRADADPHTALRLSVVSTRHVGRHAAQLHRLSAEAAHVGALLEGCQQTFDAASKEWQTAMRECEGSRSRLVSSRSEGRGQGCPPTALCLCCQAAGAPALLFEAAAPAAVPVPAVPASH